MPELRVSNKTCVLLASWTQLQAELGLSPGRDISNCISDGIRRMLEQRGYPDSLIEAFLNSYRSGRSTLDLDILEPEGAPASAVVARLDARRRDRQREELLREREREKAYRAATLLMRPVLQTFDELSGCGVLLQPISKTLSGNPAPMADQPRGCPPAWSLEQGKRYDAAYNGTELVLRLTDQYDLVLRVCRASAFTDTQIRTQANAAGLYYYGFMRDGKGQALAGTECNTVEFPEVLNWLAQAIATFEHNPPNVLGDCPLEEADFGTRTRVIDISS